MITDKVRNALRSFLRIEPAQSTTVTITERLDFNTNAAKNRIWYRGNGQELSELYRQISSDKTSFWSAVPTYGMEIRKVHTGIPRLMVDVLTSVVLADMNDIKLPDNLTDIWEEISRENNFEELLSAALSQVLYIGDGAFKISIDTDISQYPIIEFYPGDKVEFVYKRGRIREIIFKTVYKHKSGIYTLHELCLQGIISPSTLGIDVKKLDNAEAQREKEKTTLYTRNKIVGALQNVLPKLIETVFRAYAEMCEKQFENIEIEVPFGEYANPSFESQVETVGKGRTQGIMSVEACVDELYGDTKTDEWKAAEVERIKSEQGVENMSEPIFTEDF